MSTAPTIVTSEVRTPNQATPQPPAKPLTALEVVEQQITDFIRQREQAVANVHAIEGAIQASQLLLARLKAEAAKAEAFVKQAVLDAVAAGTKVEHAVEAGIHAVEKAL